MIPNVLSIAGSDSSGGAGIQADLKTFSALGCYGAAVLTALTAQNTHGVTGIHGAPPDFIALQIDTVFADLRIDAVKTGMLHSAAVIAAVSEALRRRGAKNVVVDPVMVAKGGASLLDPGAVSSLRADLLPLARVITPNLPEAAALLDSAEPDSLDGMKDAAAALHARGVPNVLVKGGHLAGETSPDVFYDGRTMLVLPGVRTMTRNTHGTGCTLSSAIAAGLACGADVPAAVRAAKDYVAGAIARADDLAVGTGHGPVHHFFRLWPKRPVGDKG